MSGSAVGFAVAAAVCFALAAALQHQAATGEHDYRSGIGLLWRLARNRRWTAGLAAGAAGFVLHAAALHIGALAVVQALSVTSLALALPLRALLDRARPSAGQALAAVVLAAGVAIFVTAARPSAGRPAPDTGAAASAVAAGAILAGACSVIATRARSGRVTGFALGLAAGTLYGLAGGVLKAFVHAAIHQQAAALAGWQPWALAVLGAWALTLHQRAYTHGPLSVSLPALSVANPLAGMVFGALVFGEKPAGHPLAVLADALGIAIIIASVTTLTSPAKARKAITRVDAHPRRPPGAAAPCGTSHARPSRRWHR